MVKKKTLRDVVAKQTSFLPEPTTKEKLAAESKKRARRGGHEPLDHGLFGSSKDQCDLPMKKENKDVSDEYLELYRKMTGQDKDIVHQELKKMRKGMDPDKKLIIAVQKARQRCIPT